MTCSREDNPADRGVREGRAQGPNEESRQAPPQTSLAMELMQVLFDLAGTLIGILVLYLVGLKSEWAWCITYAPLAALVALPVFYAVHIAIYGYTATARPARFGTPPTCRHTHLETQEPP